MLNSHPGIFPGPKNSYGLAAVRKKTCASFSISCLCKSVISRTGFKRSLPWTRQCSLAYNPRAQRINSHCAAPPLVRVQGLFQSEMGHPSRALAHSLLQMNGLWASRTSLLFWQVGQMMVSILEQGPAWGSAWAGAKVPVPVTR